MLHAIAETGELALPAALARHQAAEFLYEVHQSRETEYAFTHALTQDVACGDIPRERRRDLHMRIVDAIEMVHRDGMGTVHSVPLTL